jgi:hypothetical protein
MMMVVWFLGVVFRRILVRSSWSFLFVLMRVARRAVFFHNRRAISSQGANRFHLPNCGCDEAK